MRTKASSRQVHHVFLVPGFFGFVNFGRLVYFAHVKEMLETAFAESGLRAEVHRSPVPPTASIRVRSAALAADVASLVGPRDTVHLVGHSTGGLDARLLVTPGVQLDVGDVEPLASRVRSVVCVSTPHRGTPMARFFSGIVGQKLLWLLSLGTVAVLRTGRIPMSVLVRVAAVTARSQLPGGKAAALFDQLYDELIGELPTEQRGPINEFLHAMRHDQSLIPQLTPEGLDLFDAATADRPGVRYGCVVTRSRRPAVAARLAAGLSPYDQASYTVFEWLHRMAARFPERAVPRLDDDQDARMRAEFERPTAREDNDGIVPTLSQIRGQVIHAVRADHLDVIGHFDDPGHDPPHHDWLTSCSGFERPAFERLWRDVAAFIAESV
jgi:hypothetical protein